MFVPHHVVVLIGGFLDIRRLDLYLVHCLFIKSTWCIKDYAQAQFKQRPYLRIVSCVSLKHKHCINFFFELG